MKKNILIIVFSLFFIQSYSQNKTYWMKKFNNGTLYVAFVKKDSKFGSHIRDYFTGTDKAQLIAVKYSGGKYKLQRKNGWSNKHYFQIKNGELFFTKPKIGVVKFKRISKSDIPSYITSSKTFFRRKVVTN